MFLVHPSGQREDQFPGVPGRSRLGGHGPTCPPVVHGRHRHRSLKSVCSTVATRHRRRRGARSCLPALATLSLRGVRSSGEGKRTLVSGVSCSRSSSSGTRRTQTGNLRGSWRRRVDGIGRRVATDSAQTENTVWQKQRFRAKQNPGVFIFRRQQRAAGAARVPSAILTRSKLDDVVVVGEHRRCPVRERRVGTRPRGHCAADAVREGEPESPAIADGAVLVSLTLNPERNPVENGACWP